MKRTLGACILITAVTIVIFLGTILAQASWGIVPTMALLLICWLSGLVVLGCVVACISAFFKHRKMRQHMVVVIATVVYLLISLALFVLLMYISVIAIFVEYALV